MTSSILSSSFATRHIAKGVSKSTQFIFERGQGSFVWTADSKRFLDFTTGIGVTSTGHCHPKVVAAAQAQVADFIHAQVWNLALKLDWILNVILN